ncbi:MAG TPA: M20 family metallopeptidase [Candidatus Limnocylindrales bacterium]|nr:M20 family metallopeptidase [Candidatus Limnocylindrales bacterium]
MTKDRLKDRVRRRIEQARPQLIELSHRIHANPELAFKEVKAAEAVAQVLSRSGLQVSTGTAGMPTALQARAGSGPLHIAICAEYDALPGIGHACGHNLIAASAVGAGMGLAEVADEAGLRISVLGTPAEEGGGGKVVMLDKGVFDDVHAAMMVHPTPFDMWDPIMIAVATLHIRYTGKSSHASAFPELGVNAADALVVAQTAIGLLRQQLRTTDRVHGIVTKGGDAPNIIPEHTEATFYVRALTLDDLEDVRQKVVHCFEAGALATGAKLDLTQEAAYAEVRHDLEIAAIYRRNAEALGREFPELPEAVRRGAGSTDMGNVSRAVPSIHPFIGLGGFPIVNHQPEFTALCATPTADQAVMDGAIAMAWTAIDVAQDDKLRGRLMAGVRPPA